MASTINDKEGEINLDALLAGDKAAFEKAKGDPAFRKARDERADAYKAQQDYLFESDGRLAQLDRQLKAAEK